MLLELVTNLEGADRVVITKHGRPRAVLVNSERYALLEDMAWVLQDPGRRAALHRAWNELQRGRLLRRTGRAPLTVRALKRRGSRPTRRGAKG